MRQYGRIASRRLVACAALLLAAACGGGGAGGDSGIGSTFPDLTQDIVPSGTRVDVSGRDYFMLGDSLAIYERRFVELASTNYSRASSASVRADAPIQVTEYDGTSQQHTFYRLAPEGVVLVDPLRDTANDYPTVAAALPALLEYPTPFYPQDGIRRVVRQGSLGADLDADRSNERFRLEFSQVFLGFQSMQVMGRTVEVAAFRNTFSFSIYSTARGSTTTASSTEDAYFADGVGLVRADRSTTGPDGRPITPSYILLLTDANAGGLLLGPGSVASEVIPLARRDLVYDTTRAVYYATVNNGDPVNGHRIAVIDSRDGSTTYSRLVGASPGPLAVAADGSVLYVGLQGSGDVVKLALPSMAEVGRLRLPIEPFNQTQFLPEDLAVSPANADVLAVSLYRSGAEPRRHAGVMLVRQMVPAPRRTRAAWGGNMLSFDATGLLLFGYDSQANASDSLFRYEVLSDGLAEREVNPSVSPSLSYWTDELTLEDGVLMVSNAAYRGQEPMTLLGHVNGIHCTKLPGVGRIVCQSLDRYGDLVVSDATTLSELGRVSFAPSGSIEGLRLVPGPLGQIAIFQGGQVQLFSNALLR